MLKKVTAILISILCLSGCTSTKETTLEKDDTYKMTYEEIVTAQDTFPSSQNYSISAEMIAIPDGTYRYYVIVDSPAQPMYNVVSMIVEDDVAYQDSEKMMPSIGIYDDSGYSLVPGVVDSTKGYVKGLTLSGETTRNQVNIKMLVEWHDEEGKTTTKEFLKFGLNEEGIQNYFD